MGTRVSTPLALIRALRPREPRPRPARPRGPRARPLARPAGARGGRPAAQGPRALDLLRGPADRQRPSRPPPRLGPGVQGPLPPLPDHAGPRRPPQGRLGHPRPAGRAGDREGAGPRQQGRDRGLRRRGVQRPLPGVGRPLHRGLVGAHRPGRRVDRHRRRLLDPHQRVHRVRVVAGPPALGQGPALRGPPGHALLRPVRHSPQLTRGGARLPGHRRRLDLRALPAGRRRRPRRRPAGVDDHAVDADLQRRRRGRPHLRLRPHRRPRGRPRPRARRAGGRAALPRRPRRRALDRDGHGRLALPAAVRVPRARGRRRTRGGSWPPAT